MIPDYVKEKDLDQIIINAIKEDVGDGDHSSMAVFPSGEYGSAILVAKQEGIIAGLTVAEKILHKFDQQIEIEFFLKDGDQVHPNATIFNVRGKIRDILSSERLVLNFVQRMSGIATQTRIMSEKIRHSKAQLLDTRKTAPNLRLLDKWAVQIGGGSNHRMGLFDMIMLKDNHIDFAGGISEALKKSRDYLEKTGKELKIEVETRSLEEVSEVLKAGGCDVIMLDNMNISEMKNAVELINGKCKIEASGNITENNIAEIAACGVDYISVGSLTHSVKSLDISLKTKMQQ